MKDQHKTKAQLIAELQEIRQRVAGLEKAEAPRTLINTTENRQTEDSFQSKKEILEQLMAQRTAELRKSEEELQLTLEATADGIWKWNFKTNTLFFSSRYYTMLGYQPNEFPATYENWQELIHPDDREQALAVAAEYLSIKHDFYQNEFRLRTKSGDYRWMRTQAKVVERDENGEAVRMIGNHVDVTDQKRAQDELRASEERYRLLVETSNEGIWAMDSDHRSIFVNQSMADMLGYAPSEMLGRKVEDFLFPEDLAFHAKHMEKRHAGQDEVYERRFRKRDGSELLTLVSAKAHKDSQGCFAGSFAMFTDITQRKQVEEALQRSRQLLDATEKLSKVGGWEWDVAKQTMTWTAETYRIHDLDPKTFNPGSPEHINRSVACYDPQDREKITTLFQRCATEGEAYDFECRFTTTKGRNLWIRTMAYAESKDGHIVKVMGNIMDITERKQTEEKMRLYLSMFECSSEAIAISDHDGRLVYINQAHEKLFGRSLTEAQQMNYRDLYPPESIEILNTIVAPALERSEGWEGDLMAINAAGRIFPLWERADSIRDDNGNMLYAFGFMHDITDRKQAENALRESEEKYKSLIDNINIGVALINPNLEILAMNQQMLKWFPHIDVTTKPICYYALKNPPGKKRCSYCPTCKTMQDGLVHECETEESSGEKIIYRRIISSPIKDKDGKIIAAIEMLEDITERKLSEDALRKSEERYRIIAEHVDDIVWQMNMDFQFVYVSPSAERLLGYPTAELLSMNVTEIVDQDGIEQMKQYIQVRLQSLEPAKPNQYKMKHKNGHWVDMEVVSSPIYDSAGRLDGFAGVSRDITERKRTEEALRRSEEELSVKNLITQTLFEISEAVNTSDNLNELYSYIHRTLNQIIQAKNFFIALINDEGDSITFPYEHDEQSHNSSVVIALNDPQSLTAEVINTKKPLLLNAEQLHQRYSSGKNRVWGAEPRCWLGVPLIVTEIVIGAMVVQDYDEGDCYSKDDVKLMESTAGQVALAIERKRAEEALIARESLLNGIVSSLHETMITVYDQDARHTHIWIDQALENRYGVPRAMLIGKSPAELLPPHEAQESISRIRQIFETGAPLHVESPVHFPGGDFWHDIVISPMRDSSGKITTAVAMIRDISKRKRMEDALRESESSLARAQRISHLGNWHWDLINQTLVWSEELYHIFGMDMTCDLTYEGIVARIHPDDHEKNQNFVNDLLTRTKSAENEFRIIRPDGAIRFIYQNAEVARDEAGKAVKIFGIMQDITERKQMEESLRESEERFGTVFHSSPVGICLTHLSNGQLIDVNEAFLNMFGYTRDEVIGLTTLELNLWAGPEDRIENIRKLISQGKVSNIELYFRQKSGQTGISLTSSELIDLGGERYMLSLLNDITDRKRAEEALRKSEERYRLLLEAIHDSVYVLDQEWRHTLVNDAGEQFTHIPKEKLLGGKLTDLFPGVENTPIFKTFERVMKTRKPDVITTEYIFEDGRRGWYEVHVYPVPEGILCISRDITDRKRAEDELRKREAHQALVLGSLPMAFYVAQPFGDHGGTWVSPQIDRICGFTAEQFNTDIHLWASRLHPEDRERVLDVFEALPNTGSLKVEYRWQAADGRYLWILDLAVLIKDENGAPKEIIGTWLDITERKQAENALCESQERYRALFEDSPIAIWEEDFSAVKAHFDELRQSGVSNFRSYWEEHPEEIDKLAGLVRLLKINQAGVKLIGAESEDQVFRNLYKYFNQDSLRVFTEEMIALAEGQTHFNSEIPVVNHFGEPNILDFSLVVQPGHEQTLFRVIASFMDITARKRAEEALRTSEAQLSNAMQIAKLGYWEYDVAEDLFTFNDHFYAIYRTSVEQVGGYKMSPSRYAETFLHPDDIAQVAIEMKQALETTDPNFSRQLEHRIIYADGEMGYISVRYFIVKDNQGRTIKTYGANQDITERKQAEEALRKSEEKLRLLFTNINDVFYSVDRSGAIIEISSSVERILGYKPAELIGKSFPSLNILSQESLERALSDTMKVLSGESIDMVEYEFIAWDNSRRFGEVSGSPIIADGKIIAVASVARDITERKRAEAEKAKLEEQLRRSQKLETIGTLAGGIAHDFNNILVPIMGYADMAISSLPPSEPLVDDLKQILTAATRAKELVEQILVFSRQLEMERKPLNLQLIVKEALKLLRPAIPTTVEIRQRIDNSCEKILADAAQMHQVIVNLCTNAYQAMGEKGGLLTIELKQVSVDAATAKFHPNLHEADYVRLTVSDTGVGMNKAILDRIFEPFFTTKAVNKGTGMGLAVVHGIVRSHHGDILVYSEPGKGTTFHVYLPIVKTEVTTDKKEAPAIPQGRESILVVDDEEVVINVMKKMLERIGYRVEVCSSSIEALKVFRQQPQQYDLVLSDLTMPNMTGLELSAQIQKIRPDLPILIMTGYGEEVTDSIQKQLGIYRVIGKPITLNELAVVIRKVLDK